MKRYSSSELRSRLAEVLDAAERGESVVIERRGKRFALRAERGRRRTPPSRGPLVDIVDPAVAEGQWTWALSPAGLTFKRRSRKR